LGYQEKIDFIRKKYKKAYEPWSEEEEEKLVNAIAQGNDIEATANLLERQPSAIEARLLKINERKENHSVKKIEQSKPQKANTFWNTQDEDTLKAEIKKGTSIKQIAELLQRKKGGIRCRILKLKLMNKESLKQFQ
jgi:hypothetical protein